MASPTEHVRREYLAFVRGPVGLNTHAFGTADEYRGGVQHHGLLAAAPEPAENYASDFGIQEVSEFTVEISDEPYENGVGDWFLLLETDERVLQQDQYRLAMEY